jgi:hypothetical protein
MKFKPENIFLKFTIFFVLILVNAPTLFAQNNFITSQMEKVYAMDQKVSDPERQVGNFDPDSMPSLPIGIVKEVGQTQVIIAIDSAYFLPDGAYFSAYLALDFPGSDVPLAFAAKDIKFNPKGIIGGEQSKLKLVSKHVIELGPNTKLMLPDDGSNYVNWSCNGFESVNLHGFFLLQDGIISPPENSPDTCVTAEFEVNVQDVHNMMAMVDFSPFVVKGMDDFSFTVSEAYVDMSDYSNPLNAPLPACYQESYPDDINLWRGFYVKFFSVQLPDELNKSENPVTIFASNMFIDDAGVTGNFGATNVFSTSENALNDEWGFSVDSISVGLTLNKITKGRMRGNIVVPPLDNTSLVYTALISQNETRKMVDFSFSVSPSDTVGISCFNSTLSLYNTSQLEISRINKKFKPKLILNGDWQLNNPSWSFKGIEFEEFTIVSASPYVTDGVFSLIGLEMQAANFPVSLSNIGFGVINGDIILGADIALNFGDPEAPTFGAETSVKVYTNIDRNPTTNKIQWQYDHFALSAINLEVNTSAFYLDGTINFHDNDPVYGTGFSGGVEFIIPSVMDEYISMACAFGRIGDITDENGYRYWMIDVTAPVSLAIGPTTEISSITGGIAYHMINTKSQAQLIASVSPSANSGSSLSTDYVPNKNAGVYFKAGVGFRNKVKEDLMNGDVMFSISFNANGGLEEINLNGNVYTMVKIPERHSANNYAMGTANINYDNQEKILQADLNLYANFSGALTANIWSQMYFSPGLWYVVLGRPSNPCTINVLNFCTANAYFMMGQNLEPMPPPPPQVSSVLGNMSNQRNQSAIATGNGIACGMSFGAAFDEDFPITQNVSVYGSGSAGAGFDMTLYKYSSTSHCEGSSDPFGLNHWYLTGQVYAYAGINAGIRRIVDGELKWDVNIFQANLAVLLQGKMPKPSYVYGGIYIQGSACGFEVSQTFDFDFGTDCVIVN